MVVATSCQLGIYMTQLSKVMTGTAITCTTITHRLIKTPIQASDTAVNSKVGLLRPFGVRSMAAGMTPQTTISAIRIQIP